MVYLEPITSDDAGRFSRLRADQLDELHAFVEAAGITSPFVEHCTVSALGHYRLDRSDRRRALRRGATEVSWHDAFGRLGRLIVDGTRPPASPDFTRFGMIRRTAAAATVSDTSPARSGLTELPPRPPTTMLRWLQLARRGRGATPCTTVPAAETLLVS